MITNESKTSFIRWFLSSYGVKNREENWLLNFLLSNPNKLKNIIFVEDLNGLTSGVSFFSSNLSPVFKYFTEEKVHFNVQELFTDIKNNPDKVFYFNFEFPNKYLSTEYLSILEYPIGRSMDSEVSYLEGDIDIFEDIHGHLEKMNRENLLRILIDESLTNNDKSSFIRYSSELNELLEVEGSKIES